MGTKAEKRFGKKNFLELYAVFSSPVLYRVVTVAGRDQGSLEQDFVDRLVDNMSSFLLGGRAWAVDRVNHEERVVTVREAPAGVKPSWGGYVPQLLGFDVCRQIRRVLMSDATYAYIDEPSAMNLAAKRDDLAALLRRNPAVQLDGGDARWWTFAGGRVNHTLKYGLEIAEGWKVVADNFLVRKLSSPEFWNAPDTRRAILARMPNYRLSKFQDCLPELFALEVVESYLLDVKRTVAWLSGSAGRQSELRI